MHARRLTRQLHIIGKRLHDRRRDQRIVRSGRETVGIGIIYRNLGRGRVADNWNAFVDSVCFGCAERGCRILYEHAVGAVEDFPIGSLRDP